MSAGPPHQRSDTEPELLGPDGKVDRDAIAALYERQEADEDSPVTVTFTLTRDLDKRLDRYLVDRVPFLSRTSLQRLIRESAVSVNGRVPKPSTHLRAGDVVVAVLPPPPSNEIEADEIPLEVLFEDQDLIVVNKQPGLIVHPARSHKRGTLINALAWHFLHRSGGSLSTVGGEFARPGVVHRLDKHTSGVMVAAKSDTAHWRLGKQFERRTTGKRYLAVAHGWVDPDADMIDLPLGKHPTVKEMYAVRWDETGKPSQTVARVRERYEVPAPRSGERIHPVHGGRFSLVELELRTGRTHQIRVHLSHLGFPIAGDDMYGGRWLTASQLQGRVTPREEPLLLQRQALHAATLAFEHPISGQPMAFAARVPPDLAAVVAALRAHPFTQVDASGSTVDLAAAGVPRPA